MAAPHGVQHGKAEHSFEVVEFIRDLYELHHLKPRHIYLLFPCISRDTLKDWIYYRTRTHA